MLRAPNAYLAFAKISTAFHPPREPLPEMAPEAVVHPSARGAPERAGDAARVRRPGRGDRRAHDRLPGRARRRGRRGSATDCLLYPNVVVRERCVIGDRVILQPGVRRSARDGFGFALDIEGEGHGPRHYKVPAGRASWSSRTTSRSARTAASTARPSARPGSARGAKIDNLVQIAHNVEVGPLSNPRVAGGHRRVDEARDGRRRWGQVGRRRPRHHRRPRHDRGAVGRRRTTSRRAARRRLARDARRAVGEELGGLQPPHRDAPRAPRAPRSEVDAPAGREGEEG